MRPPATTFLLACCAVGIASMSLLQLRLVYNENYDKVSPIEGYSDSSTFERKPKAATLAKPSLDLANIKPTNSSFPFVYAFVISGCNPSEPNAGYKGFLYNILVAANVLSEEGSKADVLAIFQIAATSSESRLLEAEEKHLSNMGVKVAYLNKAKHDTFYHGTLEKFSILNLIQYERVMLLDGDLVPVTNLDYLFEASSEGLLRPNVVVAGKREPANAGFFMLQPNQYDFNQIQSIVQERQSKEWDPMVGWGHIIREPDKWRSTKGSGNLWDFHAVHADQGLLFYWVKYVKRDASLIRSNVTEIWGAGSKGSALFIMERSGLFEGRSRPKNIFPFECGRWSNGACVPPYDSFAHFSGPGKPWLFASPSNISLAMKFRSRKYFWWWHFKEVNSKLNMGVNITGFQPLKTPPLGLMVLRADAYRDTINTTK